METVVYGFDDLYIKMNADSCLVVEMDDRWYV